MLLNHGSLCIQFSSLALLFLPLMCMFTLVLPPHPLLIIMGVFLLPVISPCFPTLHVPLPLLCRFHHPEIQVTVIEISAHLPALRQVSLILSLLPLTWCPLLMLCRCFLNILHCKEKKLYTCPVGKTLDDHTLKMICCKQWFHFQCIGMTSHGNPDDLEWICDQFQLLPLLLFLWHTVLARL